MVAIDLTQRVNKFYQNYIIPALKSTIGIYALPTFGRMYGEDLEKTKQENRGRISRIRMLERYIPYILGSSVGSAPAGLALMYGLNRYNNNDDPTILLTTLGLLTLTNLASMVYEKKENSRNF